MTHDQQGPVPAHEPQGTPSTDQTPTTVDLGKAPATPAPSAQDTAPTSADTLVAEAPATTPYPAAATGEPAYGQPAYGQPGYGQPGYGQPAPAATSTDGMSIAALVTGILGLGAVPIVLGILGLKRTKRNGTSGRGLAIAGIVLGALSAVAWTIFAISLVIGGAAIMQSVDDANAAADALSELQELDELDELAPETLESAPADLEGTEDLASATPLKDIAPLTVDGFTAPGLTDETTIVSGGALEAYTASYTDGTSTVDTVMANWTSGEEATAYATTQTAAFSPDTLVDSGTLTETAQYWVYDVAGVTTLIATNETASLSFTGPADAVYAVYNSFPL